MIKRKINQLLGFLPLLFFLTVWQLLADQSTRTQFLFGSPILVIRKLAVNIANGELLIHAAVTGIEALGGFLIGVIVGSLIGFSLLYFPKLASISRPYVLALGSIPIFAFAPMMIVWFGVGIQMKIAMATFSTILVALSQAYDGGKKVDPELKTLFELNNSSNRQLFQKLILPSSVDWVLASLRLNIGLALLGAFIGEFIASEQGLGYIMLKAGGLYDIPYVLAAGVCIVGLAFLFNLFVSVIERNRWWFVELIAVPGILRVRKSE